MSEPTSVPDDAALPVGEIARGSLVSSDETARRAALWWLWPGVVSLLIGPAIGILQSLQFTHPEAMEALSALGLAYSNLRVMHTNIVIYGWLVMAMAAAAVFVVPQLAKRPLARPQLALVAAWIYLVGLVLDVALIWAHVPDSTWLSIQVYEYAEAPILADIFFAVGLVLLTWTLTETVVRRETRWVYVSLWYLLAAFWGTLFAFVVINFLTPMIRGLGNTYLHGWWIHNAVGLIITPLGVGLGYYVIPKATGKPIFSHRLGMLGFWTLYAFYPSIGLHHFLQMPAPIWLNQVAVVSSVLLVIPVIVVVYNHLASVKQAAHTLIDSFVIRFVVLGAVYYLLTGLQGAFQANNVVNPYVHFTEWVQAHAHLALAAGFTSYAMSGLIYVFPRLTGRQLVSRRAMSLCFWAMAAIFPLFFAFFTLSGLTAAAGINVLGKTVYEMIPAQLLPRLFRTLSGVLLTVGWWTFAWVLWETRRRGQPFEEGMDEVQREEATYGAVAQQEGRLHA
ncbi:MAG TPA: cbb3-type cytochrome c oxidase subunit I [Limnochordia bacterium]